MRRVIWILVGLAVIAVGVLIFIAPRGASPLQFLPAAG